MLHFSFFFNSSRKAWCEAINMDVKRITKKHVICDAHFPEYMFTVSVSKELNDWAVPKLDLDDEMVESIEYIEPEEEERKEVFLEIQCINEIEYSCDICSKKFTSRDERNTHIGDHFKTYTCNTCGEKFVGDRQFEHHRLSNKCVALTKQPNSITYECFLCHKNTFFSKRSLKLHFNRFHKEKKNLDNGANICEYCQKSFANVYIMKSHISEIHLKKQQFKCKECGKAFNRLSNLQWHELIHQNQLPCKCKVCGKSFRTLSGLNLHKRTHTGLYSSCCSALSSGFYHIFSCFFFRTGEKPYKCDICNAKSYAYNTDLKRHKRSAHGIYDKVFNCTKCSKVFYEPKFLRKHMQKVHD